MTNLRSRRSALIAPEHSPIRNAFGVLAAIILVPIAIVAALIALPFARPAKSSPAEVTAYLRDFLDGTGGDWDWDDFTSVPLADPRLESIRRRAQDVSLPLDGAGRSTLEGLLAEATALPAGETAPT